MKGYKITVNGKEYDISIEETTYGAAVPPVVRSENVAVPEKTVKTEPKTPGNGTKVVAPMPGTVLKLKTKNGAPIKKGDPIIVLEAMKMENEIAAVCDGVVEICVSEGDKINSGDVIATIS